MTAVGLRVKLYLPLLLLSVLLASYIFGLWMPRSLEDAERGYRNLLEKHLDNVADGMVPLMLGRQLDEVYGNLDHLLKENSDWLEIQLLDADGRSLYPLDAASVSKARVARNVIILKQEIRHLNVDLGKLIVKVDFTPRLSELRRRNKMLVYMLLAVALLFLLTSGLALEQMVRRPIRRLAEASKRLAAGDYATNLPKTGPDEIGTLVKSFSDMRGAVRLHAARLIDANEQLRREVAERARAEEALGQALEFSRDVMNSINDAICVIDVGDYRIVGCNTVFLNQVGLAEADALGKTCYELTHRVTEPCHPSHDNCPMAQTVLTGKHSVAEHRHSTRNGDKMFFEVSTSPIFGENGNVTQVVHVSRNITERKRIEEKLRVSAEQWQLTFDAISDGVSIHDNEMTIVRANKSLGEFLGTPSEDLLGRKCHKVFHNSDGPHPDCPLRRAANSQKPEFSEFLEPFLGRWLSISCFPIFGAEGKEIAGTVHIARDITDRKRAEDDIRRLNEELELKVEERTKQLLDAQEELVRKEKLAVLGQLAGSVGHELRNPLGVMSNAVYYLQTVLADSDDTVREYLGIIKKEIFGAERIVSDLLDAVRTRPPRPQLVSAQEVIRMSLEKCRIPENITVDIQAETQQPVLVDPFQMKQVFINLINNAVEAMPGGGELKIRARLMKDEGLTRDGELTRDEGRVTRDATTFRPSSIGISVTDTGEGISTENMKKLFQPLFTTKARGIGLGLVVIKNLTEANGGTVSVDSESGKGTIFTVTLPAAEVFA